LNVTIKLDLFGAFVYIRSVCSLLTIHFEQKTTSDNTDLIYLALEAFHSLECPYTTASRVVKITNEITTV